MSPGYWQDEPRWLRWCADPRIFVVTCAWLIVLVVLGTLVQKQIGIYLAQERYFSSWLLWIGQMPLPGGRLTLTITGLNLLAALFTRRGTRNPGLFILHAGMLLLLGGGLVGGALRLEGSLTLFEGEISGEMRSLRRHELAFLVAGKDEDRLVTFGEGRLQPGEVLSHPDLPLAPTVLAHLANCSQDGVGKLIPLPSETESERNQPGVVLRLADGNEVGICESGAIAAPAAGVRAGIRRIGTPMPFAIELVHFTREKHPGTDTPRLFSSEVIVHEQSGSRRVVITMNRPLRIGAWTLYQQSFGEGSGGTYSVLAVVHDRFQVSPYLASAIMLFGLLLHLWQRIHPASARRVLGQAPEAEVL